MLGRRAVDDAQRAPEHSGLYERLRILIPLKYMFDTLHSISLQRHCKSKYRERMDSNNLGGGVQSLSWSDIGIPDAV